MRLLRVIATYECIVVGVVTLAVIVDGDVAKFKAAIVVTHSAFAAILVCVFVAKPILDPLIAQVLRLLDSTREELDEGLTNWPPSEPQKGQLREVKESEDIPSLEVAATDGVRYEADKENQYSQLPQKTGHGIKSRPQPNGVVTAVAEGAGIRTPVSVTQPDGELNQALQTQRIDVRWPRTYEVYIPSRETSHVEKKRKVELLEGTGSVERSKVVNVPPSRIRKTVHATNQRLKLINVQPTVTNLDEGSMQVLLRRFARHLQIHPRQTDRCRVAKLIRPGNVRRSNPPKGCRLSLLKPPSFEASTEPREALLGQALAQSKILVNYESAPVVPLDLGQAPRMKSAKPHTSGKVRSRTTRQSTSLFDPSDTDNSSSESEDIIPLKGQEKEQSRRSEQALRSRNLNKQETCLLFGRWPLEIRRLVYRELVVAGSISHADKLVEDRLTALVLTNAHRAVNRLGIDATLLRTCGRIYNEALPMLYKENNFIFFAPSALGLFREKGLVEVPSASYDFLNVPSFNFATESQGRLSLLRKLILELTDEKDQRRHQLPSGRWVPHRDSITKKWSEFLQQSRYERGSLRQPVVDFPALEDLTLDFLDWDLGIDEELVARPFVERFKTIEGLRRLEIKGVKHKSSLKRLREGLLKKGGRFVVTG